MKDFFELKHKLMKLRVIFEELSFFQNKLSDKRPENATDNAQFNAFIVHSKELTEQANNIVNNLNSELHSQEKQTSGFTGHITKFFAGLLPSISSPAVLTVALTAIVGPWAAGKASSNIEMNKLQASMMTKIMDITSKSNLNTTTDIVKAGLIVKMANENEGIFDLKFQNIENKFDELEKHYKSFGIIDLEEENQKKINKISNLENTKKEAEIKLTKLKDNIKELEQNRQQNKDEIANIKKQITAEQEKQKQAQNDILKVNKEKKDVEKKIEETKKEMNVLFEKNQEQLKSLAKYTDELKVCRIDEKKKSSALKELNAENEGLKSKITKTDEQLIAYKKDIERLTADNQILNNRILFLTGSDKTEKPKPEVNDTVKPNNSGTETSTNTGN